MVQQTRRFYEFGGFTLDAANRLLLRDGKVVPLKPKVVETLLVLVEGRARVLGKEELMSRLWPDTAVEESNLTQNIYTLRKALGDTRDAPAFIETHARRGYRFIAEVMETAADGVSRAGDGAAPADEGAAVGASAPSPAVTSSDVETASPPSSVSHAAPASLPGRRSRLRAGLALAAAVAVCACAAAAVVYRLASRRAEVAGVRSVAVLPFKALGPEADDAYLGAGLADALVTKLSGSRRVAVTPTSAVSRFGGAGQDAAAAGRELGVDAVLDGSVQRAGGRVRVNVRLLRVRDGAPLWAEKFDGRSDDIFRIQDDISEHVASALTLRLSGDERTRARKHYTENAEAYQAYLRGRYFWNKRTPEGFEKGAEYFRRAVELDPAYALAHAGLADCYMRLGEPGLEGERGEVARAEESVGRALELDDTLAEAHATSGFIKFRFEWDFGAAGREYRRAIELDPAYAEAHQWYAFLLLSEGRRAEADAEIARALELDPVSLGHNEAHALYLYFTREYARSVEQSRKTLEMEPGFAPARYVLALSYEQQGRYAEAEAELRRQVAGAGQAAGPAASLAHVLASAGRAEEARAALRALEGRAREGQASPADVGLVYAGLGERERALDWYERAAGALAPRPAWLLLDPRLDPLRDSPRFRALLARLRKG
ncbi:MAG TPA: tetratricopeptide repeat protein [Pyrinomonadaceae bacterium]|jgi:TolB-like protein/DNA-binding winged helix-turn-helix (wHTH) protein